MERPTTTRLALVMLGTLVFSGVAFAQGPESEFVISSSRDVLSISRHVSYADLDLATTAGSREMEARVRNTAKTLCEKLEQMDPLAGVVAQDCVRNTVNKGLADVRIAIAAAEKKKARTASIASQE